ncbi:MAG: ABC transporter permease [Eubacterium sp.]|nr:ABC transporter permease [Eubacterium sp.]
MFIHSFFYSMKRLLHDKEQIFWSLLFPIILGTMFYAAFSNLSNSETFHAIPVAVVQNVSETNGRFTETDGAFTKTDDTFTKTIDALSKEGKDQLFESVYTTKEEALSLLENKKIVGILYDETPVALSVSSDMSSEQISQSILASFVEQYNLNYDIISSIAREHPENLSAVFETMEKSVSYNTETAFTDGNTDELLTYFFNLISMACMFGALSGCMISIRNQANLSALGARRNCSPVHKLISIFAELCSHSLIQFGCVAVTLAYLTGILKIDFGNEIGYILLSSLVGCVTGVCFGFFIGTIGKLKEGPKIGLCVGLNLMCCFFSGLMFGSMRMVIASVCPWFNHVNPTALIADSFYALTVYPSHERYFENLLLLIVISAIFAAAGFLAVRRKKYASL